MTSSAPKQETPRTRAIDEEIHADPNIQPSAKQQKYRKLCKELERELNALSASRQGEDSSTLDEQLPLEAKAINGAIEMRVGVKVLAYAAAMHPDFWDGKIGTDVPNIKITNAVEFANEVVLAINREGEDGSTLLTLMLDRAIQEAVEQGCEGVDHGE